MRVLVIEVSRSPELEKVDEAGEPTLESKVLSAGFDTLGIDYRISSNDDAWPLPAVVDRAVIARALSDTSFDIVHLAVHGTSKDQVDPRLILDWSPTQPPWERRPTRSLTSRDIAGMEGWAGRLVVSGACASAQLAPTFLAAGATAVIAPVDDIPSKDLGRFFLEFYRNLALGVSPEEALSVAQHDFPGYSTYRCFIN